MPTSAFLHPFARPAATEFTTIVRGEGAAVFDDRGRRYVDGLASLWYCQIGHERPEIADAVHAQMLQLENFNSFDRYTNEPAEQFAAEVAAVAPLARSRIFL